MIGMDDKRERERERERGGKSLLSVRLNGDNDYGIISTKLCWKAFNNWNKKTNIIISIKKYNGN